MAAVVESRLRWARGAISQSTSETAREPPTPAAKTYLPKRKLKLTVHGNKRRRCPFPLYRAGYEYYRTARGQHENSQSKFVAAAIDSIIGYDSFARIDMIALRPLPMIAKWEADTRYCIP